MELRPYQRKALVEIREAFAQKNKKVVYCLPTGGGKTFTFCAMIAEAVRKNEFCKIFIFTHRISLIEQTAQSLSRVGIAVEELHRIGMREPAVLVTRVHGLEGGPYEGRLHRAPCCCRR